MKIRSFLHRTGLATIMVAASTAAMAGSGMTAFVSHHRCEVAARLSTIHDNLKGENRYIVLNMRSRGEHYVQCLFLDGDTRVLCEAASGFYTAVEGERRLFSVGPMERTGLALLGFVTEDSEGNFQIMHPVRDDTDLIEIADLMLRALYVSIDGQQPGEALDIEAPLAPKSGGKCDQPTS